MSPPKNSPQYHLGGPTALFRCSSYCKHASPTVNSAPRTVNSATPTVNYAPPTVYAYSGEAEFTVGAEFTEGGAAFTVGGACLQKEEHINRAVGPLKWYWGRNYGRNYACFFLRAPVLFIRTC